MHDFRSLQHLQICLLLAMGSGCRKVEAALHGEENERRKGVRAKLPPGSFTSLKGTAASNLFISHTQVCLMLAKGSGGGKGEAALVVEEERIKAVHAKHPPEHAKARHELSPPLSPSLDSASFYGSRYAHTRHLQEGFVALPQKYEPPALQSMRLRTLLPTKNVIGCAIARSGCTPTTCKGEKDLQVPEHASVLHEDSGCAVKTASPERRLDKLRAMQDGFLQAQAQGHWQAGEQQAQQVRPGPEHAHSGLLKA